MVQYAGIFLDNQTTETGLNEIKLLTFFWLLSHLD